MSPQRFKHLVCGEGDVFEAPPRIRNLGPWAGSKEGEVKDLRLPYRGAAWSDYPTEQASEQRAQL